LDKKGIVALLESLLARPFEGDREGPSPAAAAAVSRVVQALSNVDAERSEAQGPDQPGAGLAAILSGTATEAECRALHEAAATSGATRLEAQSALAFIEGIEQAPLTAPAHLVEQAVAEQGLVGQALEEQALASAGAARTRPRPGVWSRVRSGLSGNLIGRRGGRAVAACAVMLMAAGLSWSLLRPPAEMGPAPLVVPVAPTAKQASPISAIGAPPDVAPPAAPALVPAAPEPPPAVLAPAPPPPVPAPAAPAPAAVQALAEPCVPPSVAKSEAQSASDVKFRVVKPAPTPPSKTAALESLEPGCGADAGSRVVVNPAAEGAAGGNPRADRAPARADRPRAQTGRADRGPAAAAGSGPAPAAAPYPSARPASPAMRPSSVQQPR
jgi:hypothetical protein